ncbi:MAG: hypothetical protein RL522_690 [Pseudomonadota bacterium]|jgi:predicted Zn-dependent protease
MDIAPEEIRLLAQIGLMAANHADVESATRIFAAIELVRPRHSVVFIGPAIASLQAGATPEAIRCLERGLAQVDAADRTELQAFLALAYRLCGLQGRSDNALKSAGNVPLAQGLRREAHLAGPTPTPVSQVAL